jgi:repressor LexA
MLTDRAREILSFIKRFARQNGYPPTIREIGRQFNIASTNGVRYYLGMLERDGALKRLPGISRGMGVKGATPAPGIPVLGRVAAGPGGVAEQTYDDTLEIGEIFGDPQGLFALRVRGDSMRDAGILPGDFVIVRQQKQAQPGEIVVALLGEEATVKQYHPRRGSVDLVPANPDHKTIQVNEGDDFMILGVVKGVIRTVGR